MDVVGWITAVYAAIWIGYIASDKHEEPKQPTQQVEQKK